jgi:hypothetical protein
LTKTNLALASLTAALPAGILAFLIVSTFLTQFEAMGGMLSALAGLTLALSALVALMPVGILVFGPKADRPAKPPKSGETPAAAAVGAAPDELSADELESSAEFSESALELSDASLEIDEDEVVVADDEVFDESISGEYDDFEFEPEEEDDSK